jgi:hypothetical protein
LRVIWRERLSSGEEMRLFRWQFGIAQRRDPRWVTPVLVGTRSRRRIPHPYRRQSSGCICLGCRMSARGVNDQRMRSTHFLLIHFCLKTRSGLSAICMLGPLEDSKRSIPSIVRLRNHAPQFMPYRIQCSFIVRPYSDHFDQNLHRAAGSSMAISSLS